MGKQSELKGDMMADKTLSVFRSELKYAINYFDYTTISQKLYNVMIEDKNNGEERIDMMIPMLNLKLKEKWVTSNKSKL